MEFMGDELRRYARFGLLLLTLLVAGSHVSAQNKKVPPKVPEELLGNEHLREEFGVNEFTTPSIKKIFDQLDALGTLPYY